METEKPIEMDKSTETYKKIRTGKIIGMTIILIASVAAAIFAGLAWKEARQTRINTNDPKKYIIESNEEFKDKLYESFSSRLVKDPKFAKKAKEVLVNAYI